jgi:hypothetical protein
MRNELIFNLRDQQLTDVYIYNRKTCTTFCITHVIKYKGVIIKLKILGRKSIYSISILIWNRIGSEVDTKHFGLEIENLIFTEYLPHTINKCYKFYECGFVKDF